MTQTPFRDSASGASRDGTNCLVRERNNLRPGNFHLKSEMAFKTHDENFFGEAVNLSNSRILTSVLINK